MLAMHRFLFIFLFSVLCIIIDVSFADVNLADEGLFADDDVEDSTALASSIDSNFIAGNNPAPAKKFDLVSPSFNLDDGPNIDMFAASCSATDSLVSRDEPHLLCPSNKPEPKVPRLPTFVPPSEKPGSSPNGVPLFNDPMLTGDDGVCPPEFRYHLCCICNGVFHYDVC